MRYKIKKECAEGSPCLTLFLIGIAAEYNCVIITTYVGFGEVTSINKLDTILTVCNDVLTNFIVIFSTVVQTLQ